MSNRIKVMIVQHSFPHYRVPFWKAFSSHPKIDLTSVHGTNHFDSPGTVAQYNVTEKMPFRVISGEITGQRIFGKTVLWHKPAVKLLRMEYFDVIIHLFETKFLSLGKMRKVQKKRGGKFILWGIGGSLKKTPFLDIFRRSIAKKADAIVFYAEANRQRYISMGLNPEKLFVAQNSIDLKPINDAIKQWDITKINKFKNVNGLNKGPVLLSVGRLMRRKRLDLLLQVVKYLRMDFPNIKVVLIGEGPEESKLQEMSRKLKIQHHTFFTGRIIGEANLAPWFLSSDLVVAPGQIGHLANHSHAYGIPLVTSDNRASQGPEIDIMIPGVTGENYDDGNVDSLVGIISSLLKQKEKREIMSQEAKKRADEYCGLKRMLEGFINAIEYVMN